MAPPAHAPLTNDLDEPLRRFDRRLGRQIRRLLGRVCLPLEPVPLGRQIVVDALASRNAFPAEEWARLGLAAPVVEPLLLIIAELGGYPSARFIPADSLVFVIRSSGMDWFAERMVDRMEEVTKRSISTEVVERALKEDWTIGRFVRAVLQSVLVRACPRCQYDLTGLPQVHTCPECGLRYDPNCVVIKLDVARHERRQWTLGLCLTALAVILCIRKPAPPGVKFDLYWWVGGLTAVYFIIWSVKRTRPAWIVINHEGVTIDRAGSPRLVPWEHVATAHPNRSNKKFLILDQAGAIMASCPTRWFSSSFTPAECTAAIERCRPLNQRAAAESESDGRGRA